ncbi:hypothetical protein AB4Z32_14265 [Massilia sp. 2TAF26]|uniref:hypothetical protein n=1 Tax=Massilia sp. 2TAF26 TaxID=3233012 RepID=UPI003F9B7659
MRCISRKNITFAALLLGCCLAHAAPLECPISPPADWKLPKARLDRARILGYLPATRADERGLAEGMPEKEWQMGGILFQSWNMRTGSRSMIYQVDCLYAGTPRVLRLNVRNVGRCMARRRVRGDALMAGSMEFRCW